MNTTMRMEKMLKMTTMMTKEQFWTFLNWGKEEFNQFGSVVEDMALKGSRHGYI